MSAVVLAVVYWVWWARNAATCNDTGWRHERVFHMLKEISIDKSFIYIVFLGAFRLHFRAFSFIFRFIIAL